MLKSDPAAAPLEASMGVTSFLCVALALASFTSVAAVSTSATRSATVTPTYSTTVTASGTLVPFSGLYWGVRGTASGFQSPYGIAVSAGQLYFTQPSVQTVAFLPLNAASAASGVKTILGTYGQAGSSGDGGVGVAATLNTPMGVTADSSGNVYVADTGNNAVRRLDVVTGVVTTVLGSAGAAGGYNGAVGQGTSILLNSPAAVVADVSSGNIYIADKLNHCVRQLAVDNSVMSLAGTCSTAGYNGNGAGTSTLLSSPNALAADSAGNIFISDSGNCCIRRVVAGIVQTIAGTCSSCTSILAGYCASGNSCSGTTSRYMAPATATSVWLKQPSGIAVNGPGDTVYIASAISCLNKVDLGSGLISYVPAAYPYDSGVVFPSLALDPWGNIFLVTSSWTMDGPVFIINAAQPQWSATPTLTPTITPYCALSLYRSLPRTDLVGTLVGSAIFPSAAFLAPSELLCRQACCDAVACDAYSFASATLLVAAQAQCFLYVNVTALVPSSLVSSGALLSAYS